MVLPRRRHHTFVGIALLALLVSAVAPAVAAPPPRPLCDGCGDSFAEAAAERDVDISVVDSTATVRVHGNGTATWVVRNRIADSPGLDRLREDAGLRAAVAERAMWDTDVLSTTVTDDGVVVTRYRDDDFAEQTPGGALRSDAFTEDYSLRNLAGLGADELTVVAPDGMRVAATVPGSTRSDDGRRMTLTEFTEGQEGEFVTFVPRDSLAGPILSFAAVVSAVWLVFVVNLFLFFALPTALFGLLVGAVLGGLSWFETTAADPFSRVRDQGGVALAVAGALVTLVSLLGGSISPFGIPAWSLFGAGVTTTLAGGVLSRPAVRRRATYRTLLAGTLIATVVATAISLTGALLLTQNGVTRSLLSGVWLLVPVFTFLPVGYAFGRGNRRLAVATAMLGLVVTLLPIAPLTTPQGGNGFLVPLVVFVAAVVATVVGSPLLVVGASLAADLSSADATPSAV